MNVSDALTAVTEAGAALTRTVAMLSPGEQVDCITPHLERLQRAVSRVQTILVMHPDLTTDDPLPRNSWTNQDAIDRVMTIDALELMGSMPSAPATLVFRAKPLDDGSTEDVLRGYLNRRRMTITPSGHDFELDITNLCTDIAQRVLPVDQA